MKRKTQGIVVALVSFERFKTEKESDYEGVLPNIAHGATGWMACLAENCNEALRTIQSSMSEIGLQVVDIDDVAKLESADHLKDLDEELFSNFSMKGENDRVFWGTLHIYLAEGEG